jgi:hypothetical protein
MRDGGDENARCAGTENLHIIQPEKLIGQKLRGNPKLENG